MSYCASCGAAMPAAAVFCGNCGHRVGTPIPPTRPVVQRPAVVAPPTVPATVAQGPTPTPPPPPTRRNPMMAVLAVLAMAAIGAGIIVFATRGDKKPPADDSGAVTTSTALLGSTSSVAATVPTTTLAPDPLVQLQQLVASDRATADTLVGHFVVQVSAKKIGLTVNGLTYGPADIYDDHQKLRSAYSAILVDASQFKFTSGGKSMDGWYLTIVTTSFPTKVAADKWCTDHGLPASDCFSRVFMPPK